ncbi:uncharacterized protein VNE69_03319 [Vairimorpha necatrix]|uniref:Uncharacterized protein n=1 Tax=Vairimorpha necatrix TaxID=6039 RepID=A0AAX4JAU5_9MICR
MNLLFEPSKLNPLLIKKYSKNLHSLPESTKIQVCLYKILEHNKLRFLKYLPPIIISSLLQQDDIKFYSLKLHFNLPFQDKLISELLSYIISNNNLKLLTFLEKFSTNKYFVFIFRRILKQHKFLENSKQHKFSKFKEMKKYLQNNLYVPKIVSRFLDYYKEFLPEDIVSNIIEVDMDISYFIKMIKSLRFDICNVKEELMKYEVFRDYAIRQGFKKNMFLIKYVKRDDFEFYLRINKMRLEEYFENGVVRDYKYYPHLQIYNFCLRNKININLNKEYIYNINVYKIDTNNSIRDIIKNINLESLFYRDCDILLLDLIIIILCTYKDTEYLDKLISLDESYGVLDQSLYYTLVNTNMIEYLKRNIKNIKNIPDDFLIRDIEIEDIERYKDTYLRDEMIQRALCLSTNKLVTNLLNKYEDERGIYYKILRDQIHNTNTINSARLDINTSNSVDIRIFDIETSNLDFQEYKIFILENFESDEIYNKVKDTPLFFKYCISHSKFTRRYFQSINPSTCTLEEGKNIHTIINKYNRENQDDIKDNIDIIKDKDNLDIINIKDNLDIINIKDNIDIINIKDNIDNNLIYKVATALFADLDNLTEDKVYLLNLVYHIRYNDGLYLFYKYSDVLIRHYINDKADSDYMYYLNNKYLVYVLDLDPKYFRYILKFISSLDFSYIKLLISLLNDTNLSCVQESKRLLNNMKCINTEINNLKSQIIESFINKMNTQNTLLSILSLQFNYMIDDTSLYFILELVRRYIKDYKEYIFIILSKIEKLVINKEYYKKEIINILSIFVIQNNYYIKECRDLIETNIKQLKDEFIEDNKFIIDDELDLLVENIDKDLRVGYFLVEILKIINDDILNEKIFRKKTKENEPLINRPNFLAYAFDLEIFYKYLEEFLPVLKKIYISRENKIAVEAFKKLIKTKQVEEFIIRESFINISTRLSCIEILHHTLDDNVLTVLYIYKYDTNALIRKRVTEVLKNKVENYNILLKRIYQDILRYLDLYYEDIQDIASNVISELISKYSGIIDYEYSKRYKKIYPLLLVEGIKKNKLIQETKEYLTQNNISNISTTNIVLDKSNTTNTSFIDLDTTNIVLDNISNISSISSFDNKSSEVLVGLLIEKDRDFVYEYLSHNLNIQILKDNPNHVYNLLMYKKELSNNLTILEILSEEEKRTLLLHLINNISEYKEGIIYLLQNIPNLDLSTFNINIIYLYLVNTNKTDINLYKKVFSKLEDDELQVLIEKKNYKNIVEVTYKNIKKYDRLLSVLMSQNNIKSIERINEIYEFIKEEDKERVVNYLIYNYLIYENRSIVKKALLEYKINKGGEVKLEIINMIINNIM